MNKLARLMAMAAVGVTMFTPSVACADTWTNSNGSVWTYALTNDCAMVVSVASEEAELSVPASLGDKPATLVGAEAFADCAALKSVIFPNQEGEIGFWQGAFKSGTSVTMEAEEGYAFSRWVDAEGNEIKPTSFTNDFVSVRAEFTPVVVVKNVSFRQRYPWNGLVDIDCTVGYIDPTTNITLSVSARDEASGRSLAVRSVWLESDETHTNGLSVTAGSYRLVWDAGRDNAGSWANVIVTIRGTVVGEGGAVSSGGDVSDLRVYNAGTDYFLGNSFFEMGLTRYAVLGSGANAPTSGENRFHPREYSRLSFISLLDSRTTDFFIPGSSIEGWYLYSNDSSAYSGMHIGTSGISDSSFEDRSSGGLVDVTVANTCSGGLKIEHNVTFSAENKGYLMRVRVTNTSGVEKRNVQYIREVDPDQAQSGRYTGSYHTDNYFYKDSFGNAYLYAFANNTRVSESDPEKLREAMVTAGENPYILVGLASPEYSVDVFQEGTSSYYNKHSYQDWVYMRLQFTVATLASGETVEFSYICSLDKEIDIDGSVPFGGYGASFISGSGTSVAGKVDVRTGTRIADATEQIAYSPRWGGAEACVIDVDGISAITNTEEGVAEWMPEGTGRHTLTHTAGDTIYTAQFTVLGEDVETHAGTLTSNEVWSADKVHLVTTAVTVPSGVSLTIEPGAVVKFMSDTGLTVSGGGACIARGAIFTHANDDTVGGDTLCDGEETAAVMGDYTITGSVTDDDSTEYRYMPPQTLTSNISSNTRLRGYRTYIASNSVTVASGATLTLQPGTIIKFNSGCQLTVNGTLDAQGTRAVPIVFTSLKDDVHGGDTNGDGDKTQPAGGNWNGIWVYGRANIAYAKMMYSGNGNERGIIQTSGSGALTMDGCTVAHAMNDGIWNWGGTISVKNTVFIDTGWATAPYRGSKNEYINCIFYGNDVGMCYWSHWSGNPVYRNCIFANCGHGWCELGSGSYGAPPSSVGVYNCLFWNPVGLGLQSCGRVGSNGNVWGDPLFEDAENGDFRIKVNSPCVDAGDGGVAPETDYYGRPRMDNYAASNVGKPNQDGVCPDIGIYEADGRAISPSADLAVLRVDMAHSPTVAPGDTIALTYAITNCGVIAATGTWRDEISLVSSSGRTVVLSENIVTGNIPIGGTLAGTASFTVPAVEEGTWRVRINANAQHDIYEGARTANNVFTSGDGIEVSVVAQSPSEVSGGSLKGGVPHVVKLAFAEGDVNRMVILSLSEGGVASWGFGHVPDAVSKDGTAVTDASGKVSFIVPDGDVAVYIVLESDTTTPWSLTAESPKTSVIGIAPSSGAFGVIVRAVVSGGGFTASNLTVRLVSNGGGIATSATYVNDETIILDIDTGLLAAGEAYDVEVIGEMGMAVLEKAFSVEAPAAKGVLSAKLDLPSSARQGRVAVGYVVCANSGNAEMDVPVFAVSGNVGDIALRGCEATNRGWTNSLWLVGISPSYPKGRLKPGDEVRIPFEFMVNGTYHMELVELDAESPLVRDSVFPSWQKFSAAIASSATVLNGISGNICDYGVLYDYAIKSGYGDDCGIVRGVLFDDVSGAPLAQRTVVAIDPEGIVSDRAVTDASGAFVFSSLVSTNTYIITGAGIESSAVGGVKPENALASEVTLAGHDFATICAVFCENGELVEQDVAVDVVPVLYCENGARWPTDAVFEDGMFRFFGIPDGNYTLGAECGGETFWAAGTNISISVAYGKVGDGTVVSVPVEKCGRVLFRLEKDGTAATGVVCHAVSIVDGEEVTAGIEATTGKDGIARFNLKPGSWRFSVSDGYRLVGDGEIAADVLRESEIAVSGAVTFVPFTAFPDVGPRPLPVSFSADFLPDSDAVASYAWDFDGDGVTDSTLATPSYTYSTSGKKVVSLSVVYTNGTSAIYSDAAAVDVWDEEFVELETSTLLLDAASGYRVVSRTEDSLVLEYTREAVPADFSDVVTIVIPGEESSPLAVRSWSEVDDGIIVETTASSPMRAYRSMRMATVTTLGSNGEMMCSYKDVPIGPWTFSTELCTDGQWRKRGTTQSRMGVALAIEWNTGTIHYLQAVDKDEGGKIVFWESRFKGRWEPEATISGQIEADGQKNRRGRGVRGSPYKPLSVNDQLLALVAGVPICYSAGAEFTATTSLGGEIAIRPAFDVDIGYRYAPDRGGNKPYKTFRSLDDARGLAIRGKGELDLYAGLFAEIYAGANKKAGTKEFGLKVCDITVGGGVAAKASLKVSSDEFEPDEYSFGIYGRFKFDFAPVEVNLGLWKFKPLNVGWHPEKEIIKKDLKTPVPTLNISREGRTASGETVAFENKTNYGKWSCSGSGLDNGDREFVNLPKGKKYSHFYSVSPEDTRKCEVVLREKYSFYVGNHPIINPTKANKYSFTVRGSKDPPPPPTKKKDDGGGSVPKSWDPNEMTGPLGSGEARLVKPGDVLTYTVYFENKADAEAAAQEVRVTNPLSEWLDWSTFEMGEVAFNNQVDLGLGGKSGGVSEATMNGTNFLVRTEVQCDTVRGAVDWYLRIVDPTTETTWPSDILTGFLPPNDDTHRGEGHLTYRIKVRDDAPVNVVITNSASIVFDFNDPIETDPAWWNTVGSLGAQFSASEVVADEGGATEIRVSGGSADAAASVKVYLTYNTAAAADVDVAKGTVADGDAARSASGPYQVGLKFPMTLTWEAGEVGEKVITIPMKSDKTVEDDELFTLQLADAEGMELGEERVCTVTIRDATMAAGKETLQDAVNNAVVKMSTSGKGKWAYAAVGTGGEAAPGKTASASAMSPILKAGEMSELKAAAVKGSGTLTFDVRVANDALEGESPEADGAAKTMLTLLDGKTELLAWTNETDWTSASYTVKEEKATSHAFTWRVVQGADTNAHAYVANVVWSPAGTEMHALSLAAASYVGGEPCDDPFAGGTVSGGGVYPDKTKISPAATAKVGWEFVGWAARSASGPYQGEILSNKAKWQIVVTNDAEYVAVFEKIPYVRGLADPADGGKVSGSGLCARGKKVTLKATAGKNFAFLGWRQGTGNGELGTGNGEWGTGNGFVATTATLVIDRSAKPAANSKTSTTITDVAEDVTYFAVFKSDPKVTVSVEDTDEKGAVPTGKGAGKYVAGTITGEGKYAPGKKVTLKASANKGYVFSGWEKTGNGEQGTGNGDVWSSQAASLSFEMPSNDVEYVAMFVTAEEDKASIALAVDGTEMRLAGDGSPHRTNIWAGVYLEWSVAASALSETKVKVAGLPSGLKFTDKPVTSKIGSGKTAVTVTNVLANTIYGAPTAASKTDRNGNITPSAVKVTVTTAGKSTQTYQIDATVNALPAWAQGTFAGGVFSRTGGDDGRDGARPSQGEENAQAARSTNGVVSLTIDAKGKISGKALGDGLTYTLAAPYYIGFEEADGVSNFVADVTASWSYKEGTKTVKTNDVVQVAVADNGIGGVAMGGPSSVSAEAGDDGHAGRVTLPEWTAWQYNWKAEPWKTLGKSFDKKTLTYAILADGSFSEDEAVLTAALGAAVTARVTLKFAASGAVSVAGEFVAGYDEKKAKYTTVKASGSATLVPVDDEHGEVFIYLTPKGLAPHARCVDVPWPEE